MKFKPYHFQKSRNLIVILIVLCSIGCKVKTPINEPSINKTILKQDDAETNLEEDLSNIDYDGGGKLRREVFHTTKPSGAELEEEGTVVINVCVNQEGEVIYAKYNEAESTIHKKSVWKATEARVKKFKFKKDYNAEPKQCGKYTIRFSLD